jgi:hypothetical protein
VGAILKRNLPIETLLARQISSFLETVIFFFGECFAVPVSSFLVPGFNDLSLVDPNNRYAVKPSSVMRARTSSLGFLLSQEEVVSHANLFSSSQ